MVSFSCIGQVSIRNRSNLSFRLAEAALKVLPTYEAIKILDDSIEYPLYSNILKGHTSGVNSAEFSPDGKKIVTASGDNTARIWLADWQEILEAINKKMISGKVWELTEKEKREYGLIEGQD